MTVGLPDGCEVGWLEGRQDGTTDSVIVDDEAMLVTFAVAPIVGDVELSLSEGISVGC